ncbi:hypothetical protein IW262DRAFT_1538289 [Armillaria fumosa]|nr:hypothetical protein IW262DRAFT_1538289 [Armillaria fumosa]
MAGDPQKQSAWESQYWAAAKEPLSRNICEPGPVSGDQTPERKNKLVFEDEFAGVQAKKQVGMNAFFASPSTSFDSRGIIRIFVDSVAFLGTYTFLSSDTVQLAAGVLSNQFVQRGVPGDSFITAEPAGRFSSVMTMFKVHECMTMKKKRFISCSIYMGELHRATEYKYSSVAVCYQKHHRRESSESVITNSHRYPYNHIHLYVQSRFKPLTINAASPNHIFADGLKFDLFEDGKRRKMSKMSLKQLLESHNIIEQKCWTVFVWITELYTQIKEY